MKTTLDLPDDLVHAVKLRAVMQRRTVKALVADLLRQGLGMAPAAKTAAPASATVSMVQIDAHGLPVVRCQAAALATAMSALQLGQLEQAAQADEDLQRAGIAV